MVGSKFGQCYFQLFLYVARYLPRKDAFAFGVESFRVADPLFVRAVGILNPQETRDAGTQVEVSGSPAMHTQLLEEFCVGAKHVTS